MGMIEISVEEYRRLCMMEGKLEAVKKYYETEEYKNLHTIMEMLCVTSEERIEDLE